MGRVSNQRSWVAMTGHGQPLLSAKTLVWATVWLLMMSPVAASAQIQRNFWGVNALFEPKWQIPETLEPLLDADDAAVEATGFEIGLVRGSVTGRDWGVSFVSRTLQDDLYVAHLAECAECVTSFRNVNATLRGMAVHRFLPVVMLKDRLQLGVTVGGGVGWLRGNVRKTVSDVNSENVQDTAAQELFRPWGVNLGVVPLATLEFTAGMVVGSNLKLKVSSGLRFPGYNRVSVGLLYLFGPR